MRRERKCIGKRYYGGRKEEREIKNGLKIHSTVCIKS